MAKILRIMLLGIVLGVFPFSVVWGQISERVYRTEYHIDTTKARQLSVELDNLSFFKDNEFQGPYVKGYSLPGLWVQPKLVYYPLRNIKVELGAHFLLYHGANKYPSMAYLDIADWKGNQYQKGSHILPYFRAQVALSERFNIVFGNLYGAANHRLIEPLYNPELNLTCDPETGLQLLFDSRVFDMDLWVNWQSFIFKDDTHKEAFTVGFSSRLKANDPESPLHFYFPIQALAQHRGGEIDTIYVNSVQTLMNGAVGAAAVWNVNHRWLRRVEAELDGAFYYQQAGHIWPFDSGYGLYLRTAADLRDFRVKLAYWHCDGFISMFGSPFYGAVSMKDPEVTLDRPNLLYYGVEYARPLGKGFSLGVDVDLYHALSPTTIDANGERRRQGGLSFSAGAYLRINPSFLLKQF